MKNISYNINNDELSDLRTNTYSTNDINYKNTISSNESDINNIKDKGNNNIYNTTSNNIESEIENDLRKISCKINKNKNKKIDLIDTYLIQLKHYGYPEIGKIYLSEDIYEQTKTQNFFEFLLKKEKNKKIFNEKNNLQILKNKLNLEYKRGVLLKQELNEIKLQNKNLTETLNKFESMKNIIINAFETMDYVQSNDMTKIFSRVKGAEKLIETLKFGYNESIKELNKENIFLKNFVIKINNEFCYLLNNQCNIDENIYNFSFIDSINLIKESFKKNFFILKKIIFNVNNNNKNSEDDDDNVYNNIYNNNNNFFDFNENSEININNKFVSEDIK